MVKKDRTALVCGAGGFIGSHLVKKLKAEGFYVKGVDLKYPEFSKSPADEFVIGDLRDPRVCKGIFTQSFDEVYQLAADMGGAGFIFTGENDADIMHNSAICNLNISYYAQLARVKKLLFTSSACIYPERNQLDPDNPQCSEDSAYPAAPDSEYGWEKIFSERLYASFKRNYDLQVRIARLHNIFGPESTWQGGREKAPAAICRKVALAQNGGEIEIWGDGKQTRSFLYIDECLEGLRRLMDSDIASPLNIGSDEMVTINKTAKLVMKLAKKGLELKHIQGPLGVRGRTSDNKQIKERLGWAPSAKLEDGLAKTYEWIEQQTKVLVSPR